MYDTLMQMGRWFGYRAGYNDLVGSTPPATCSWYRDITVANEELNNKFDEMAASDPSPAVRALRAPEPGRPARHRPREDAHQAGRCG